MRARGEGDPLGAQMGKWESLTDELENERGRIEGVKCGPQNNIEVKLELVSISRVRGLRYLRPTIVESRNR